MEFHGLRLPQSEYKKCKWEKHAKAVFQNSMTNDNIATPLSLSEAIRVTATTVIYDQKPFLF
jgi:hypothetical protein